ncbi:CU044_2847 family protein [uncultured Aliivibrio sp.]|uniref:CU044_2847 family protein n=1 Tax=uncultured Aliivibrio sp. TaxID=873085 RepID=UPI0026212DC1|nr:CU044_2847 family protein [uncultured Aliivibrio sp.]
MNQVIKLNDGIEVEIELNDNDVMEISHNSTIDSSIDKIEHLLNRVIEPINNAYLNLKDNITIESAKVNVGIKFGASGNVFVAKSSAEANISVELTIKAKK